MGLSRQGQGEWHFSHRKTSSALLDVTKHAINSALHKLCKMFSRCTANLCAIRKAHIIPRVWSSLAAGRSVSTAGWSCLKCISRPCVWLGDPALLGVSPGHVHFFQQASNRIFLCILVGDCGFLEDGTGAVS